MANLIKYLGVVLQLIPILIDIIKKLEEMFPGAGSGAEKLALAQEILGTSAELSGEMKDIIQSNWPRVAGLISKLVSIFNKRGWETPLVQP